MILVIVGVPVAAYSSVLKQLSCYLKENAIVTDVGSVKKSVIKIAKKNTFLMVLILYQVIQLLHSRTQVQRQDLKDCSKMGFVY